METEPIQWQPLRPDQLARVMADLPAAWWIAGGWAIDLFLGTVTRHHADIDVAVLRRDQRILRDHLSRWDLQVPAGSEFRPWNPGEDLGAGINSVWCRRAPDRPWSFEVMFLEADGDDWVYRRATAIRSRLANLGRRNARGLSYLSPEIQLLFKAKYAGVGKNEADFARALPRLHPAERAWLADALACEFPAGHPWVGRIAALT
jgi:hypothetical protein